MKNKNLQKLIVVLGPTTSGKTDLAIKLAKKFNGEVVSADSRQVYKGMDIATAKPLSCEFKRINSEFVRIVDNISHHLMDVVRPNQEFNVVLYKKMATIAIKDIQKRGKIPFLVGGTGLYIQSVVDDIEFPKVSPQKKLRDRLEKESPKELFRIYKKLDPQGAKFIDKNNKRRLIRAIEVSKFTKKAYWQQRKRGKPLFKVLEMGIKLSKKELKERIKKRVEKMFRLGLEKEVGNLVKKYGWDVYPLQTIGYQEWFPFLNIFSGALAKKKILEDKKRTILLIKKLRMKIKQDIILHTGQFAKRQMTWFKRDKRITWIKTEREAEKLVRNFLKKEK